MIEQQAWVALLHLSPLCRARLGGAPVCGMHTIASLRALLAGLPSSLPSVSATSKSRYNFSDFTLPDDVVADIGTVGAVNHELEVRLGARTGRGDTFELMERGPGIEALSDVLAHYTTEFPDDILLQKWVDDACRAAELIYHDANVPVSVLDITMTVRCLPEYYL